MNKVFLIGRTTDKPEYRDGEKPYARYTLAVDGFNKEKGADFINCVCFGKAAQFAAKYLQKGTRIAVEGRIQTGSYKNKEGRTVYTTDVIVDRHEFCETLNRVETPTPPQPETPEGGSVNIPDGLDSELPFR